MAEDMRKFGKIIATFESRKQPYTADDVIASFRIPETQHTLFIFMQSVIEWLKSLGKRRTAETYTSTLNSFIHFQKGEDKLLREIDSDSMVAYEAYLKTKGICTNSTCVTCVQYIIVQWKKDLQNNTFRLNMCIRESTRPYNAPYL